MSEKLVKGVISSDWAESLIKVPLDDWHDYNPDYKHYDDDVREWEERWTANDLSALEYMWIGNLSLWCSEGVYTSAYVGGLELWSKTHLIDVAFGKPARLTSTALITQALIESEHGTLDRLALQHAMPLEKLAKDGNDTWAIPADAIELARSLDTFDTLLPHQANMLSAIDS